MASKNTMGVAEYINIHLAYTVLIYGFMLQLLPSDLFGSQFQHTDLLMVGSLILLVLTGVAITLSQRRNYLNLVTTLVVPTGLFVCIGYYNSLKEVIHVTLIITGIVVGAFSLYCLVRRTPKGTLGWKLFLKRLSHTLYGIRLIIAFGLLVILICFFCGIESNNNMEANVSAITAEEIEEATIAHNIDVVCLLEETAWENLSLQERLDVFQVVANIERRYLGIPFEVTVVASEMPEETWGEYDHGDDTVYINKGLLESAKPWWVLDALCHEMYHAYQKAVVLVYEKAEPEEKKLMLFREAEEFSYNMENYVSGEDDPTAYTNQYIEKTADAYARSAVEDYYNAIAEYMSK